MYQNFEDKNQLLSGDEEFFVLDKDNPNRMESLIQELFSSNYQIGYVMIILSSVCGGLGNSLEPVSILTFVHISLLLLGVELIFEDKRLRSPSGIKNLGLVLLLEGLGFVLGFNGIFAYPKLTVITVMESVGFGILLWICHTIFAIIPYVLYYNTYPKSFFNLFLFPALFTVSNCSIVGNIFSTFSSPGNSVLDYAPLRAFSFFFGIYGINFLCVFLSTLPVYYLHKTDHIPLIQKKKSFFFTGICLILLFTMTGFVVQYPYFYQVHEPVLEHETVPVSCVLADTVEVNTGLYYALWNTTLTRIQAGDAIVLMSEEALLVHSDEEENLILSQGLSYIAQTPNARGALLGITYEKTISGAEYSTNRFALLSSTTKSILWNYSKAHPVPVIEADIEAGPGNLLFADTNYGYLSGAICFDLDYPQYIAQAGRKQVDLFLQPSWTWNAIYSRHFEDNALRAIENGFTLFRCSSDGESGIVDPYGKFLARQPTGHDPTKPVTFNLPLRSGHATMYPFVGFVFEYILIIWGAYYWLTSMFDWHKRFAGIRL
jgi:apolipoprotein N-acyltransferase